MAEERRREGCCERSSGGGLTDRRPPPPHTLYGLVPLTPTCHPLLPNRQEWGRKVMP